MAHVLMEQAKRLALLETVVECSMSFGSIVPNLSCEQTRHGVEFAQLVAKLHVQLSSTFGRRLVRWAGLSASRQC